jgi:hypothetical protein
MGPDCNGDDQPAVGSSDALTACTLSACAFAADVKDHCAWRALEDPSLEVRRFASRAIEGIQARWKPIALSPYNPLS